MNGQAQRVLVVEDEAPMRTVLADALGAAGFRVLTAADGEAGLKRALDESPDLVLLDVMMPRLDGFAVAAELRRLGRDVPILMLTAKGQVEDRVRGLDHGADDYLVKPFSTGELLARVRALMRRFQRAQGSRPTIVEWADVRVDFARMELQRGGKIVHLTAKEFSLLRLLVESGGEAVTREQCLDRVWGVTAFPTTRTVDTHLASLRAKLGPAAGGRIRTVHGVGYAWDGGVASSQLPDSRTPE
jgi:DNA-binding response OmpR family regulator